MAFVTRSGATLSLSGSSFHAVGCNMHWLGLYDNTTQPTQFEIDDAINTAKEMGATVIRSHTLGISVGSSYSAWPTLNPASPNLSAFNSMDYAIYKAGLAGLKLLIPLTDNWHYYHGGKHTFTDWRGVAEASFYTDANVITDFQAYISFILNRVNQFNSIAYKNDDTIFCWETGNELANPTPPPTWTQSTAAYIKTIAPNHLVMDGTGIAVNVSALSNASVDLYTDHFYPPKNSTVNSEATSVSGASRVYVVGEFGWSQFNGGTMTTSQDSTAGNYQSGSKALKCVVAAPASSDFFDQIQQVGLTVTAGHSYTLTFWMKALASYTMSAAIQSDHGGFQTYSIANFIPSNSWSLYTLHLSNQSVLDTNTMVEFNLGLAATTTWIDNVSLTDDANPSVNLLTNADFEDATLTPWFTNNKSIDTLSSFLANSEVNSNVAGDLFWLVMPHASTYGFHLHGGDTYSMYYPGNTSDMLTRSQQLRTHAYKMRGINTPPAAVIISIAPVVSLQSIGLINVLLWQGIMGAATYVVQKSNYLAGPFTTVTATANDFSTPLSDTGQPPYNIWYRIAAVNVDGIAGPYSAPINALSVVTGFAMFQV